MRAAHRSMARLFVQSPHLVVQLSTSPHTRRWISAASRTTVRVSRHETGTDPSPRLARPAARVSAVAAARRTGGAGGTRLDDDGAGRHRHGRPRQRHSARRGGCWWHVVLHRCAVRHGSAARTRLHRSPRRRRGGAARSAPLARAGTLRGAHRRAAEHGPRLVGDAVAVAGRCPTRSAQRGDPLRQSVELELVPAVRPHGGAALPAGIRLGAGGDGGGRERQHPQRRGELGPRLRPPRLSRHGRRRVWVGDLRFAHLHGAVRARLPPGLRLPSSHRSP